MTLFNPLTMLQLDVERDTDPGELVNLVQNPDGELGGWGWISPVPNTSVRRGGSVALPASIEYRHSVSTVAGYFTTEGLPVIPTRYVSGRVRRRSGASAHAFRLRWEFVDATGAVVASGPQTALVPVNGAEVLLPAMQVPSGAVQARMRVDFYRDTGANPSTNAFMRIDHVVTVQTATATDPATVSDTLPPAYYSSILGPSVEVTVERAELDAGTLRARVIDPALDPAQGDLIRPGRRVRFRAVDAANDLVRPLFAGKVTNGQTTYDPGHPNPAKRAKVNVTAVDAAASLGQARPNGVASIDALPFVLEGCGVPWSCNGSGAQVKPDPPVVAVNDQATALDQVALTRDSNLGYAWVDGAGVMQVWDRATITATVAATLDEDVYGTEISIDYDTDRCINSVTVIFLRYDATTGSTEEVTYGPFRDDASVREWGEHPAEFKIQWAIEDDAAIATFANQILAANATPVVRVNELTIPIVTEADVLAYGVLDLYDLVTVVNTNAGISESYRITSLKHTLTTGPTLAECRWSLTLGFAVDGGVASPTYVPAPTGGVSGLTFTQAIRPVGEVSMWFGEKADCPAGWLVLDGATFDAATFPRLATLLGGTTLPNMTDRMPVGAGTKALGSSGGSATHTHSTPNHSHGDTFALNVNTQTNYTRTASGTGVAGVTLSGAVSSGGAGTTSAPSDGLPPWRALWFIIRAV